MTMRKASAWRLSTVLGSMLLAFIGQAFSVAGAQEARTVKERLSDKASDNQRVDNCHVLVERRGPEPRPDCPAELHPSTPAAEAGAGAAPKTQ